MTDIDLIPLDYRAQLRMRQDLRTASVVVALLVSALLLAGATLQFLVKTAQTQANDLSQRQQINEQQSAQLQSLDEQIRGMSEQLKVLTGLRGGHTAADLLLAVDRALNPGSIWFSKLEFGRAGSLVEPKQQAVNRGYFVVLPAEGKEKNPKAWKIDTHLEVAGHSQNYATLSAFVSRLLNQPEVESVRILRSALREHDRNVLVDFELAVIVAGGAHKG